MPATLEHGRVLLEKFNHTHFEDFLTNEEKILALPVPSYVPGRVLAPKRVHHYEKVDCHPSTPNTLTLIKKNEHPHGFVWRTTGQKLRDGIRWGIIKPPSLTGQIISTLGQYRLTVHERVAKGLSTKTQAFKLNLLDHFQDRLDCLSELESLVNSPKDFKEAFTAYIEKLEKLKDFQFHPQLATILPKMHKRCLKDIENALQRAKEYQATIQLTPSSQKAALRARGELSIIEFVKREAIQNLYELQGLNQDLTYSRGRDFALTRGDLNDSIEDARKALDDHRADPRNQVTQQHHGHYAPEEMVSFYFDPDKYSEHEERQAMLGVSFIEQWDKVDYTSKVPRVTNDEGKTEDLSLYAATYWRPHRSPLMALKSFGYFLLNVLKSFFMRTQPWEEESWQDKDFHLCAATLKKLCRPNEPLVIKLIHFIRSLVNAVQDFFNGIIDFTKNLTIELPAILKNDWDSTHPPRIDLLKLYSELSQELQAIATEEANRLKTMIAKSPVKQVDPHPAIGILASTPYDLSVGEQNDILTAMVRGVNSFMSVFTHPIYAKDPVGGVIFTFVYISGGMMVLCPEIATKIFGKAYVDWFNSFSQALAQGTFSSAVAGASTEAQLCAFAWDLAMTGPRSNIVEGAKTLLSDPLKAGAVFWLAYGSGYLLAHEIPGTSEVFSEELGTVPELTYPVLGAKVLIALYEALEVPHPPTFEDIQKELVQIEQSLSEETKKTLKKIEFVFWLSAHANQLNKLDRVHKFHIEQQIENLFTPSEANSFKSLLKKPQPKSVAYQLIGIPLAYIPSILRCLTALGMGLVALIRGNARPFEPIRRAFSDLGHQIIYDLTRLLIFTNELLRMIGKGVGAVLKAIVFTGAIVIGRIAGLFQSTLGHSMHTGFGAMHRGLAWLREALYPARLTRNLGTAHPHSTTTKFQKQHRDIMKQQGPAPMPSNPSPLAPSKSDAQAPAPHKEPPPM